MQTSADHTGLWPESPPSVPLAEGCEPVRPDLIFPSGRTAIAQALEADELPAHALIAIPDWGSVCVARAVRPFGTPVSLARSLARLKETDAGGVLRADGTWEADGVSSAVVYEQWGWPFRADAWQQIAVDLASCRVVVDRVDSADFFARRAPLQDLRDGSVEIVSLSKVLGLPGGGLARRRNADVVFKPRPVSAAVRALLERSTTVGDVRSRTTRAELFKALRQAVNPSVLDWLRGNSLSDAFERERRTRQQHLQALLEHPLGAAWPGWMVDAIAAGAGPVWAPILGGDDQPRRWRALRTLAERYLTASAVKMFNWSGNPLQPSFAPALALPVHSGATAFGELLTALAQ